MVVSTRLAYSLKFHTKHWTGYVRSQSLGKRKVNNYGETLTVFYTSNVVSHELPAVECKGRRFFSLTLGDHYSFGKKCCVKEGKRM